MQIVITVGEEGQPTTQILGPPPVGAMAAYTAPGEDAAIDAGAGPDEGEDREAEPAAATPEAEGGDIDGGSAPAELEGLAEPMEAAPPIEAGAAEDAGPEGFTISNEFPEETEGPRLRPVD